MAVVSTRGSLMAASRNLPHLPPLSLSSLPKSFIHGVLDSCNLLQISDAAPLVQQGSHTASSVYLAFLTYSAQRSLLAGTADARRESPLKTRPRSIFHLLISIH